jgi:DNA modification methylase
MSIRLIGGDCREVLATLPANSVHCVVTSPPYYGLRDYGTAQWAGGDAACDHQQPSGQRQDVGREQVDGFHGSSIVSELKTRQYRDTCGKCGATRVDRQIGLEATPDAYLAEMVAVFREVRRVMHHDAVAFINMGDSFANKQLLMMPARLALALQADGWWLRSDIIWHKPNPMPESVTDRPTGAHEHVFLLAKSARYFYDADAVRETSITNDPRRPYTSMGAKRLDGRETWHSGENRDGEDFSSRSLRNVWTIATAPYSAAHFATFPPALGERCIRAGTSERGCCAACGAPWGREGTSHIEHTQRVHNHQKYGDDGQFQHAAANRHRDGHIPGRKISTTTGWSPSCACDADIVPCTVLDPFAGAGTTLLVADRLQRDAIGIELSPDYTRMAMDRCRDDAPLFAEPSPPPAEPPDEPRIRDLFA